MVKQGLTSAEIVFAPFKHNLCDPEAPRAATASEVAL